MKKIICSVIVFACLGWGAVFLDEAPRGVPRGDLVGKRWDQLLSTNYPGFGLPLPWSTSKKYELRLFEPAFEKYIVTVNELQNNGSDNNTLIVAALDFSALKKGELPEQDCFYKNIPPCEGRLCNGLLIGVINQKVISDKDIYRPLEVWKITVESMKFERVSPKNVICKPQSYAE